MEKVTMVIKIMVKSMMMPTMMIVMMMIWLPELWRWSPDTGGRLVWWQGTNTIAQDLIQISTSVRNSYTGSVLLCYVVLLQLTALQTNNHWTSLFLTYQEYVTKSLRQLINEEGAKKVVGNCWKFLRVIFGAAFSQQQVLRHDKLLFFDKFFFF